MNEEDILEDFLSAFDILCLAVMAQGIEPAALSGAVLARVQHLYLADGTADVEGLVRLLQYSVDNLTQRPKWDIT